MGFPAQVLRSAAFPLVHLDVTWVDTVPFYPQQIKSQQPPFGLAKTPGSSFRESSTLLLQVGGPMADDGQAVRGRERQRALLRAPVQGRVRSYCSIPRG